MDSRATSWPRRESTSRAWARVGPLYSTYTAGAAGGSGAASAAAYGTMSENNQPSTSVPLAPTSPGTSVSSR